MCRKKKRLSTVNMWVAKYIEQYINHGQNGYIREISKNLISLFLKIGNFEKTDFSREIKTGLVYRIENGRRVTSLTF